MASNDIMDAEDKARIELTQNVRGQIIREMLKDGKLPKDKEDRDFLMKSLDGMDRTVLAKTKIKSDDAAAKNQAQTAKLIADVLTNFDARKTSVRRIGAPTLGDVPITLSPGETFIGVETVKYTDIMQQP